MPNTYYYLNQNLNWQSVERKKLSMLDHVPTIVMRTASVLEPENYVAINGIDIEVVHDMVPYEKAKELLKTPVTFIHLGQGNLRGITVTKVLKLNEPKENELTAFIRCMIDEGVYLFSRVTGEKSSGGLICATPSREMQKFSVLPPYTHPAPAEREFAM